MSTPEEIYKKKYSVADITTIEPPKTTVTWKEYIHNSKNTPDLIKENTDGSRIPYKYSEEAFINVLKEHVDRTYTSHYSGQIQPIEFIMSNAQTLDYLKGNAVKYIYRYGKKNGNNPEDLMKACHFIMMMMHYGDKINK